jgi:methionine-rich copper-binding protein CopC
MKRILSSLATLSLSVAAIIGVSSPALAHSDELKTSPEQGSTVEAGRIPITLTFGEELLTGDESISHEVVVANEAGELIPALCASAEGFDLSTAAAIDQPGKYTVTWRTVSADGHPVDGSFDFNVVNNTDYDAATDAVDACVYAMATSGETPMLISENKGSSDSLPGALFIGAAFAGVLVVIWIATRRTLQKRASVIGKDQLHKNKSE